MADRQLAFNINPANDWFADDDGNQDQETFHESSHFRDTKDHDPNRWNDPHVIDDLMDIDFKNFGPYDEGKREAEKNHAEGKCICPVNHQ